MDSVLYAIQEACAPLKKHADSISLLTNDYILLIQVRHAKNLPQVMSAWNSGLAKNLKELWGSEHVNLEVYGVVV